MIAVDPHKVSSTAAVLDPVTRTLIESAECNRRPRINQEQHEALKALNKYKSLNRLVDNIVLQCFVQVGTL